MCEEGSLLTLLNIKKVHHKVTEEMEVFDNMEARLCLEESKDHPYTCTKVLTLSLSLFLHILTTNVINGQSYGQKGNL